MRNQTLRIPAVLIHNIDGTQYRVNGTLVDLNESTHTCSMKFEGYDVQDGIPLSSVYITEGFLDKVKEYGKAAWEKIKRVAKSIGGLFLPIADNGQPIMQFANTPTNIAIMQIPGVGVELSDSAREAAEAAGCEIPVNSPLADAVEKECQDIEKFWGRVMKEYSQNESMTSRQAVKYVLENYYKPNAKYTQALNEASIVSLHNKGKKARYGIEIGTEELVGELYDNILEQIDGTPMHHSDTMPLMIWGAPGIGKTALVNQVLDELKEDGYDLTREYLQMSAVYRDDFVLPDTMKNSVGGTAAVDVPKTWMPVYYPVADPVELQKIDDFYNSGKYRPGRENEDYNGGVIFLDEYTRMPEQTKSIAMGLINEHSYAGMFLASHWGFVLASNRYSDMLQNETELTSESAQVTRYQSRTYVPTKEEWLKWARKINRNTGKQNVDEMICKFLEISSDGVWYDALDLHSRDNYLNKDDLSTVQGDDLDAIAGVYDDNSNLKGANLSWNPRTWTVNVNGVIMKKLQELLGDKFDTVFVNGNLDMALLQKALDRDVPDRRWERFASHYAKALDADRTLDRFGFFSKWISRVIEKMSGTGELPSTEWNTYTQYRSVFTKDVVASIWNSGKLGKRALDADNDKTFDAPGQYEQTTYSKWKRNSALADEVKKIILNGYPLDDSALNALVLKDLAALEAAPEIDDKKVPTLVQKWANVYKVDKSGKTEYLLFAPTDATPKTPDEMVVTKNILKSLETSEFARQLANVAYFLGKTSIQMNADNLLGPLETELGITWPQEHLPEATYNRLIDMDHLHEICKAKGKTENNKVISKFLIFPAIKIVENTRMRSMKGAKTY